MECTIKIKKQHCVLLIFLVFFTLVLTTHLYTKILVNSSTIPKTLKTNSLIREANNETKTNLTLSTSKTMLSVTSAGIKNRVSKLLNISDNNIPLWTLKTVQLSETTFNWWSNFLQRGIKSEEIEKCIQNFFNHNGTSVDPRENNLNQNRNSYLYSSCAVVGSSDVLTRKSHGKQIDAHEQVFRFNNAPIKGYEEDVGSRTTHRILYPESADDVHDYNGHIIVFVPFKIKDLYWITSATTDGSYNLISWKKNVRRIKSSPSNVWIISPELMRWTQQDFLRNRSNKWPSTGIIGVLFSLHYCAQVSVYGFGPNDKGEWGHYYEKLHLLATKTNHDSANELNHIKLLYKKGLLKFYAT